MGEIDADRADCLAAGIQGRTGYHRAGVILVDDLRPQAPVACADLRGQLRVIAVEDLVAQAAGRTPLILESVKKVVFVTQAAECKQVARNLVVGLAARLPALGRDDAGILAVQAADVELVFPRSVVTQKIQVGIQRGGVAVAARIQKSQLTLANPTALRARRRMRTT